MDEIIQRLNAELKKAAVDMSRDEVRFLVDTFYGIQDYRIQLAGQLRSAEQKVDHQPVLVLSWMLDNMSRLESQIELALKHYAKNDPVGAWALSVLGIGPIISAGLLAHIDITQAPTVGHIWSLAGLNPKAKWIGAEKTTKLLKALDIGKKSKKKLPPEMVNTLAHAASEATGITVDKYRTWFTTLVGDEEKVFCGQEAYRIIARRPWNAKLKTLCWKIGKSFVMVHKKDNDTFGHVYASRKAFEQESNASGKYADTAARILESCPSHEQAKTYKEGRLPDGHIDQRSRRYAVKLFLASWHEVAYIAHYGKEPPNPYPIEHLGHAHKFEPPHFDKAQFLKK